MDYMNNNKRLPAAFLARIKEQLGPQYEAFVKNYDGERSYGLRYNPLKADRNRFISEMPFNLREIPWAEEGFFYDASDQPGKSILHEAGAFYIQEPSAMAVVPFLDPQPGERILDLCAAPGGKSTQTAGRMQGKGLLVSNEVVPGRAKILSQNIERLGVANCVVCKEKPDRIADAFPAFFDRVLVDAPCSGEGMFRKDDTAIAEWSPENVSMCADRQREILKQAARTLRPGGILVYSTCTFSLQENEEVINDFVQEYPEFSIEDMKRLWPHLTEGEGHFMARLHKADRAGRFSYRTITEEITALGKKGRAERKGRSYQNGKVNRREKADKSCRTDQIDIAKDFLHEELELTEVGIEVLFKERVLYNFGDAVYLVPEEMISMRGLSIERPGLQLGFYKKDRFEPSHALALFLHPEYVNRHYALTKEQAACYLRGETFAVCPFMKGWYLLSVQGYSMGFGKAVNGQMKNHYPKGLRRVL